MKSFRIILDYQFANLMHDDSYSMIGCMTYVNASQFAHDIPCEEKVHEGLIEP